jgi:hypothetical protein
LIILYSSHLSSKKKANDGSRKAPQVPEGSRLSSSPFPPNFLFGFLKKKEEPLFLYRSKSKKKLTEMKEKS